MLTCLPSIPPNGVSEYQTIIKYTDISTPQHTASFFWDANTIDNGNTSLGIPEGYVVYGTFVRVLEKFTGGTLSSLTASMMAYVPGTIQTDITYYGTIIELTQLPTQMSFQTSGPPLNNLNSGSAYSSATNLYYDGPHDIAVYFTATGAYLNALTAGSLEVIVQIKPL